MLAWQICSERSLLYLQYSFCATFYLSCWNLPLLWSSWKCWKQAEGLCQLPTVISTVLQAPISLSRSCLHFIPLSLCSCSAKPNWVPVYEQCFQAMLVVRGREVLPLQAQATAKFPFLPTDLCRQAMKFMASFPEEGKCHGQGEEDTTTWTYHLRLRNSFSFSSVTLFKHLLLPKKCSGTSQKHFVFFLSSEAAIWVAIRWIIWLYNLLFSPL